MTRHRMLERSDRDRARCPARCRRHAVHRAPGYPDARHARREPGARRSGGGTAGRHARARRDACVAQSLNGTRSIPASEFFTGLFSTVLEPGELLTAIEIPRRPPAHRLRLRGNLAAPWRFRAGRSGRGGRRRRSGALHGRARCAVQRRGPPGAGAAGRAAARRPDPVARGDSRRRGRSQPSRHRSTSDIHASSAYRRQLARVLTRRVLERAFHSLESV